MLDAKVEKVVWLLASLLVFLVVCLFASEVWFRTDGQFFQAISGMATGVLGALLGIIPAPSFLGNFLALF